MNLFSISMIKILSFIKCSLKSICIFHLLPFNIANLERGNLAFSYDTYIESESQEKYILNATSYRKNNKKLLHSLIHALEETTKLERIPTSGSKRFKDVTILSASGIAIISDFIYLDNYLFNFEDKIGNDVRYTKRLFKRDQIIIDEAISLSTYGIDGYYHWLYDVLPKLLHLLKHTCLSYKLKIIINGKKLSFKEDAFELLDLKSNLIYISESRKDLLVKNCIIPDFVHPVGVPSIATLQLLRNSFKIIDGKKSPVIKRIYVGRKAKRRNISNENHLITMLSHLGFRHYYLENMPFGDQVNLFKYAEIIVGPHGAGLSNIVFSEVHFKLIELFPSTYNNACYFNIAMQLDAEYFCFESDTRDKFDNFKVDIKWLESSLIEILSL
jgi:hypothetical protein